MLESVADSNMRDWAAACWTFAWPPKGLLRFLRANFPRNPGGASARAADSSEFLSPRAVAEWATSERVTVRLDPLERTDL